MDIMNVTENNYKDMIDLYSYEDLRLIVKIGEAAAQRVSEKLWQDIVNKLIEYEKITGFTIRVGKSYWHSILDTYNMEKNPNPGVIFTCPEP